MPKKISKAALEALVTAGKTAPAVEDENKDKQKPAEGEGENLNAEGADLKDSEDNKDDDKTTPTAEEALQADLTAMQEKYDASQIDLAELTTKLEKADEVVEALKATHTEEMKPLCAVIEGQINTMRIALSLTSVNMEAFAATALMVEYDNIRKTFESSLIVGGVVPNEEGEGQGTVEPKSRNDVNEIKNLGF